MNELERAARLIEKGERVLQTHRNPPPNVIGFPTLDSGAFSAWQAQAMSFLESRLGSAHPYYQSFAQKVQKGYQGSVKSGIGILKSLLEDIQTGDLGEVKGAGCALSVILNICEKFHRIGRQLRSRHNQRETLDIQDEYDVQDLIHSLLHLHFEDIRAEEWTPSYGGKSSRMDFLLKNEKIVIETKKTRNGLRAKDLGSQLIEDIGRYQSHPDCNTLICFVYDPDGLISNPRGIENDLRKLEGKPIVQVIIRPG
ncbi:MAG: hypothetical protein JWO82_4234 [Akkermansiaceae bacterium]|nr:hypothetical protein [Akkermansiaceae bacterium]